MNNLIMGIDIGYSHTKTVSDYGSDSFRSTVRDGVIDINTDSTVITYKGKDLTIGEHGRITVDTNKIEDKNFLPLLFTAILRNTGDLNGIINVNLVTGLPIAWYPKQKDKLRNRLTGLQDRVEYKGREVDIHIKNCIVFPQSAGLALNNPEDFREGKTNLVIDIGGLTVDVSYYEGRRLVEYNSYQLGMLKLYSKLSSVINSEYNIETRNQDIERFIKGGYIIVGEKEESFDFDYYLNEHVDEIITRIKTDFPYDIVHKKTFVGGGALTLKEHLPSHNGIKCNEILFNAEAFYNVGLQKYE